MPISKRNKQIELAKTKKRGFEWKKGLFEEVRSCVDKYENVFVFSVNDMRNNKMKNVREQWRHSRFFIGKNKIMAMALGRFAEEEYRPNLHKLGQQIKGQRGLLFTNKPVEEVLSWFRSYSEGDYARSGNIATETVVLHTGPLTEFPHSQEPYLRQLGLPTTLEKGVIHLIKDHEVCKTGDVLTPEAAKILKLLGYEMAEFHLTIDCAWSKDGSFVQLTETTDADAKENKKKKKKKKLSLSSEPLGRKSADEEEMEVELNDKGDSDQDEEESNDKENSDSDQDEEEESNEVMVIESENKTDTAIASPDGFVTTTSTPKSKSNEVIENVPDAQKDDEEDNLDEQTEENGDQCDIKITSEESEDKSMKEEIQEEISNKPFEIAEDKTAPTPRRGRPRVSSKTPKVTKKEKSFVKTPDANTSQDSPVFRELRTRSVKFSRKKK